MRLSLTGRLELVKLAATNLVGPLESDRQMIYPVTFLVLLPLSKSFSADGNVR